MPTEEETDRERKNIMRLRKIKICPTSSKWFKLETGGVCVLKMKFFVSLMEVVLKSGFSRKFHKIFISLPIKVASFQMYIVVRPNKSTFLMNYKHS